MLPEDRNAIEGVNYGVVVRQSEGDGARIQSSGETETAAGDGDGGAEVKLDGVVKFVGVNAVDLRYVEVTVRGEHMEDPIEELESGEPELRRKYGLKETLTEG